MKILVNAISLYAGGGKVVGKGIVEALSKLNKRNTIIVIAPQNNGYKELESNTLKVIEVPKGHNTLYKFFFKYYFKRHTKKYTPNTILNLCNIPLNLKIKELVFFHMSYFVYPKSSVWKMLDIKTYIIRKYQVLLFKLGVKNMSHFFAQTTNMRDRLNKFYNIPLEKISLTPTAVNFDNFKKYKNNVDSNIKSFLYLTRYYEHKNIEILVEVAKEIKKQNLPYKIILTINKIDHPKVKSIIDNIKAYKLENIIENKGFINYNDLPKLYSKIDALIMPTLLESLSTSYLEAMYFNKPIFTSNIDFATVVCKDVGIYFNPFDEKDILNKMKLIEEKDLIKDKINQGQIVFSKYPKTWEETADIILKKIIKI